MCFLECVYLLNHVGRLLFDNISGMMIVLPKKRIQETLYFYDIVDLFIDNIDQGFRSY